MDPMIPKEFREKFAQTEDLTRSPQVNELIKICREIETGKGEVEVLKAQLDILYDVHEAMTTAYEALSPTQPRTEIFVEKGRRMRKAFDELKEGLDETSLYLEDEDIEHFHIGLDTVKKAMDVVFDASDSLKKEEDAVEILSHSPPINELLRIGRGVLKGEFKPYYFYRRYEIAEDIYAKTYSNMEKISKMPPDTKAMEEQLPVIMNALKLFREGLDDLKESFAYLEKKIETSGVDEKELDEKELEDFLEEDDEEEADDFDFKEVVAAGLDKIQEASKQVYEANLAIKEGIDKSMEEDAKKKEWQAKMPSGLGAGAVGGGFDIKVGETAAPPQQQEQLMLPPNYKKVYDAAWAVAKKEISKEEFVKTLEWLASTVNKNMTDIPKLVKPKGISEQEEEVFNQTKNSLTAAMESTMKGLEEMRLFTTDDVISHLENGLDVVMRAGDLLYKVQMAGEEAAKKMQQAKSESKKKK